MPRGCRRNRCCHGWRTAPTGRRCRACCGTTSRAGRLLAVEQEVVILDFDSTADATHAASSCRSSLSTMRRNTPPPAGLRWQRDWRADHSPATAGQRRGANAGAAGTPVRSDPQDPPMRRGRFWCSSMPASAWPSSWESMMDSAPRGRGSRPAGHGQEFPAAAPSRADPGAGPRPFRPAQRETVARFTSFAYAARSWKRTPLIGKAEHSRVGANPRFANLLPPSTSRPGNALPGLRTAGPVRASYIKDFKHAPS